MTVFSPGIRSIPRHEYHADPCPTPSLSSSIIQEILRSPSHAWHAHPRLGNKRGDDSNSRADIGTIAHSILLEGDESGIVVVDADDFRTKAAREQRDAAWADGKQAIIAHKMGDVRNMVAVATDFIAASGMQEQWEAATSEAAMFWQDGTTWCRALIDKCGVETTFDYKTATNAKPDDWSRTQMASMGYDVQAAWYLRGRESFGDITQFVFLVQEIDPPYACSWVGLSPAMRAIADRKIEYALAKWRNCLSSNEWPAYSTDIHWPDPMPWQEAEAVRYSFATGGAS